MATSSLEINAVPLQTDTTHPRLHIISPLLTTSKTVIGNQGTSTRTRDIVPCTNNYHLARSGQLGRPVMSASRNKPRETRKYTVSEGNLKGGSEMVDRQVVEIGVLERHPFSTQSFVPMGHGQGPETAYVIVVADSLPAGEAPDLETVRAYTVRGDEGICYGDNLWHAPMCVVNKTLDFAIFQFLNGVAEEDCEMVDLKEPLRVVF